MDLLKKLQAALNDNKENGILDTIKFVYVDIQGSLKLVLQNPCGKRSDFFCELWIRVLPASPQSEHHTEYLGR